MATPADRKKEFCGVYYADDEGKTFGEELKRRIRDNFGIEKVKVGWETINKDVFDTMVEYMEKSVFSIFVYTQDMEKHYKEWFEKATKLAQTIKKPDEVVFVIIAPYTVERLREENKYMAIYDPLRFGAHFANQNDDQWQRLLDALEGKADAWRRQNPFVVEDDYESLL